MSDPEEKVVSSSEHQENEKKENTESAAASMVSSSETVASKPPEPQRPSSLPKPSGLKPPSKIGRLCANSTPKPAVPPSPRTDGSTTDSVRKLSDELSRKHLSDLLEADEDEVSSSLPDRGRAHRKASSGSVYSGNSMDALWEKHPRRLSEAGLRRSSDHSVVLTEDTDSFIIGERVWVGGTKPGQIAYIGETQFAPGDWAGIVLDEPIGKNDGSVAGVRYFQCAEKRGVFSRLTRLTRAPLPSHAASPASDAGSVFDRPPSAYDRPPSAYDRPPSARRALSPNGSIRSAFSSKMNASMVTSSGGEFRLGDRVIVSSSRGSKAGLLRYVGVTDFAPGVWAGVELDDPLGKNDGSVEGKRYFECAPRFGLFAPISKVSRSPSNRKPGACAIHSNGRTTPLRRSNSRESMTSLGTSLASSRMTGVRGGSSQRVGGPRASSTPVSAKNALQELLREKQHHLERLMRERELERADVAKITLQAERAETALTQCKKEAQLAGDENSKLKFELDKLNKLLEDERQKVEDLMFRNEEENINKDDYIKYKEEMEKEKAVKDQRIRELEAEAVLQASRAEATAATLKALEEQRTAEINAMLEQHKEELTAAHTLSAELQKLLDEAYALLKEKDNEKDSVGKSMSEELTKLKSESEKALNEAKTKMAIVQTEFETQLSVLTAKLQLTESKLEAEKQNLERLNKENSQTVIDLNAKLAQLQATLDDKTQELNKITGSSKEHELNLSKEITKLKMELSAKVLDLEQLADLNKKQELASKLLQDELSKIKEESCYKINEYESLLNEASQENEKKKTELFEIQQSLAAKTRDYDRLLNESKDTSQSSEQLINEFKQTIHERDKEISRLKEEYEKATASFNINQSKIAEEHKKEIEEKNNKIDDLIKEITNCTHALDKSKVDLEGLSIQFATNVDELKLLKEENEKLKQSVAELTKQNNELKAQLAATDLEIGDLKRQLVSSLEKCEEIQKAKEKAEQEYLNLTGQTTNSNEQFNKLSQHLKETEKELQELKDKYRDTINNHGRIEQELKQKLLKSQEDFSNEHGLLIKSSNEFTEKILDAENKIKTFQNDIYILKENLKSSEENNDKIVDENTLLKNEVEILKQKEKELVTDFDSLRKKLEDDIERYKEEVSILKAEGATSEVKLMEKVDQLIEAQNDLNNKLEESRKHEEALQKVITDMTNQLDHQRSQYEQEVVKLNIQVSNANTDLDQLRTEEAKLKESFQEKDNHIKESLRKIEMLEVEIQSNVDIIKEKDRQITQVNEELCKVIEIKKQLEEDVHKATLDISTIKQQYDNLVSNYSVDETMLKHQQEQMETSKKEIAVLTQEKTVLEQKCSETLEELGKLKSELQDTLNKLQQNLDANNELKKCLGEKETFIKTQSGKSESDSNKLKNVEEELNALKQEIIDKNVALQEKELQLNMLNERITSGSDESQQKILKIQNDYNELNSKYKSEKESFNNTLKSLQTKISEQDKQIEEMKQLKEKVEELQILLKKSDNDIKQLTNINEGQKSNYEEINKQLQTQYDELKKESKRVRHELKQRLSDYESELKDSKEKLKAEIEKQNELQTRFAKSESNVLELSNKLELLSVQQNASVEKDDKLEKLTLEMQSIRKSNAESTANNEVIVKGLKSDLDSKIKDIKAKDDTLSKLQEEVRNYKARIEIAEREKVLLQKQLENNSKSNIIKDKNDNSAIAMAGGDNGQQSIEDREMVEGQVSFLNSVIVDMQKKNEQLMARVQALESGATTQPESPVFNGRRPRAIAPRLFCDICDVFDAHDTEDCPRQAAADDDPPPPPPGSVKKPPPPPRPYCDICEVFGHSTENCDEEETF